MQHAITIGTINQIDQGTIIYNEGQQIESVALILKGSVRCSNGGFNITLGPGEFIGLNDLYIGSNSCTTVANEACAIFAFAAKTIDDIDKIIDLKQEYKGYVIKSLNRLVTNMYDSYYAMIGTANEILSSAKSVMDTYKGIVMSYGGTVETVYSLTNLEENNKELPVKQEWADMVKELQAIPVDVITNYYSYIPKTAHREIKEKIKISTILMNSLKTLSSYVTNVANTLISDGKDCLFKALCRSIMVLAPSHANYNDMVELVDKVVELVNRLEKDMEECIGRGSIVNRTQMEALYYSVISGESADHEALNEAETEEDILNVLDHSLEQIINYGEVEQEVAENFTNYIREFAALHDKSSTDEAVRKLRHSATSVFYYVYKKVFTKAYEQQEYPKAVELFLHFGFVDEKLLSKEQLVDLYHLKVKNTITHYCNCYTIYEWLVEIYEGRKEPSKNDMDQDYRDYIRQMNGKGKLTPAEEKQLLEDYDAKLEFELSNMFEHNMKLTSGRISTFVPFLYGDAMPLNIEKYFLSPTKVDEAMRDILAIDFSAYYREVIFSDPSIGIQRELLQKECVPDILLFPTCGANGVMWQETANKLRDSSARFCIAILHEADVKDTMIKLTARFRWELCRTLQGLAWNDIKNKCLTSEYCDYIQFYRKNKDLSEERKEKLKQQIQKARNNTRECFVIDYEQWIKFESSASIRLNKCSREILAQYCPFEKGLRQKLSARPQYADSFVKYERDAKSRARVLDAKILSLRKNGYEVPKEIESTAAYFNNK